MQDERKEKHIHRRGTGKDWSDNAWMKGFGEKGRGGEEKIDRKETGKGME